jgi:ribose 5-phosphate isomerase B
MRIAVACDHNGVDMKGRIVEQLRRAGHLVDDLGSDDPNVVIDYPPQCVQVGARVVNGRADRGIVIGGSGQGEHIACNKIRGIRAGLGFSVIATEISRTNNDSNVLVVPAKVLDADVAAQVIDVWLATPFRGGVHQRRLDQIAAIERGEPFPPAAS